MKEIKELLAITKKLRDQYKHLGKQFTLDGKLVGDIGEVLAAEKYGLVLYSDNTPIYDGYEISTGKQVQIKASFKENCYFPARHVPDYFLAIHILETGEIEELYNGSGHYLKEHYIDKRGLKGYQGLYYILSKGFLRKLNSMPDNVDKIAQVRR